MAVSIVLSHISALLVAVLVLLWALAFRTTIFLRFYSSSVDGAATATAVAEFDHLYFVLHTLLMVIGFILFGGEGILAHRWGVGLGWARGPRKAAHLWLQGAALGFGVAGLLTKFKGNKGVLANFHSLHSWMGLLCLLLFAAQWTMGFLSFWNRGEGWRARTLLLPWHVFIGIFTYSLAVATAESGLMEKMAFLHTKHGIPRSSLEFTLINVLGLTLAIHCGLVVFTLIPVKHKESSNSTMTTRIGNGVSGVQSLSL
ncbi:B561 family [Musa troglodytarum]|uniref:B561 family n=2 Tax=Musa troglodytarum TaxID=320322 RepID=A0A9E7KNW7_9LILI|nr:B561 family [Musa troglodytarum]